MSSTITDGVSVFKANRKKDEVVRPLILVVIPSIKGQIPNREKFLANLGLPFKLDIVKSELRVISFKDVLKEDNKFENLKAVIIHLNEAAWDTEKFITEKMFEKPMIHFTALAYKSMTEEEKARWKIYQNRLVPSKI
jgi:hypothetical protein